MPTRSGIFEMFVVSACAGRLYGRLEVTLEQLIVG